MTINKFIKKNRSKISKPYIIAELGVNHECSIKIISFMRRLKAFLRLEKLKRLYSYSEMFTITVKGMKGLHHIEGKTALQAIYING